jgi:hypothetical protein
MAPLRIVPVLLALVVALTLAGCAETGLTTEEIVEAVVDAQADMETVELDMTTTTDMSFTNDESFEMTMTATMTAMVDYVNREMKMEMETEMDTEMPPGPGPEEGGTMEMEIYIVDGTMYTGVVVPGEPELWIRYELPEEYWEEMSGIQQATELLDFAQVEILGSEVVGGADCYVLRVVPDMERLWEIVMEQPGMSELMGEDMLDMSDLGDMIKSYSVKEWVARDTLFPMKVETRMTMVMSPETLNLPPDEGEFEMTMDLQSSAVYRNHNSPVSIELPAEAEEAVEMPSFE